MTDQLAPQDPVLFLGVGVALVTLFEDNGAVDVAATRDLAVELVGRGVKAILVAGTTGEAESLELDEREQLTRALRNAIPGEVPILVGTGAASARQAVTRTQSAVSSGADAVLVLSPPRTCDPRPYYEAVSRAAGKVPLLGYHFPAVSPPGIPVEMLNELPLEGCKDSSGDPARFLHEVQTFHGPLYLGSPTFLAMAKGLGATGALLAIANALPEQAIAAFEGDFEAQLKLGLAHKRATLSFPHGIKEMTSERFGTSRAARLG